VSSALRLEPDYSTSFRFTVGIQFKNPAWGGISGTYWNQNGSIDRLLGTPGNFVFYEALAAPGLAGFKNDGLADGFRAIRSSAMRDYRIDYFRTAVDSEKFGLTWTFGYRRVTHRETNSAAYYALVPPGLPPLIGPAKPELFPGADTGTQFSSFSGNGFDIGADLRFVLHPRVTLESGLSAGILWGRLVTSYTSTTYAYLTGQGQAGGATILDGSQYDNYFLQFPNLDGLSQAAFTGGVASEESASAQCYEAHATIRYRVWHGLVISGGFRAIRYDGIAATIRPTSAEIDVPNELIRIQTGTTDRKAISFNGLWLGIGYRY
jgi:hypothetical protein